MFNSVREMDVVMFGKRNETGWVGEGYLFSQGLDDLMVCKLQDSRNKKDYIKKLYGWEK